MKSFRELAKVRRGPIERDPYADRWYGTLVKKNGEVALMTIDSRGFTSFLPNHCLLVRGPHDD